VIKEDWVITHNNLFLDFDNTRVQVDLAGEKLIATEQDCEKIAVEIKSFLGASTISEFYMAIGRCFSYRVALREEEPERSLYLAIPVFAYKDFSLVRLLLKHCKRRK
jgi:hypothetical protein